MIPTPLFVLAGCSFLSMAPVSALPNAEKRSAGGFDSFKTFFVFGDSVSTTEFNPQLSPHPSQKNPIGSPYPGLTTCYGENWIDRLTTKYSKKVVTWNFAISYSTVDKTLLPPVFHATRHDMHEQITLDFAPFCTGSNTAVSWTGEDALFFTFIGHNDIAAIILASCLIDPKSPCKASQFGTFSKGHIDSVVSSYIKNLAQLYTMGARHFVAMALTPDQTAPFIVAHIKDVSKANKEAGANLQMAAQHLYSDFNAALNRQLGQFQRAHPGSHVSWLDTYGLMEQVMHNPKSLGYENVNDYCTAYATLKSTDPLPTDKKTLDSCRGLRLDQYLYKDPYHPTSPFHAALADQLYKQLK